MGEQNEEGGGGRGEGCIFEDNLFLNICSDSIPNNVNVIVSNLILESCCL